jgi:RND family efflux transporter MFP subunit
MVKTKARGFIGACSCVLFVWSGACGGGDKEIALPPPPEVTVAVPDRGPVQEFSEFSGNTRAVEFANIRARVQGTLEKMMFTPSIIVQAGDVLFEIEPEPYRAERDQAAARVESAKSKLDQADSDLQRVELAGKTRAVSQQDIDQARSMRDQARANLLGAKSRLEQAEINLGYTRVHTPITGRVSRRFVDLGNLVGAGEPTLLTTVTRIDPIYVYFDAPEDLVLGWLSQVRERRNEEAASGEAADDPPTAVRIATAADEDFPHQGYIDYIDNTVDATTGTIEMRAIIDNKDEVLFPGLFVRVRILGEMAEEALKIDERAVGTDLGGKYVLVVGEENVVEQRYVELGRVQDDGSVRVIEGLEADDRYIVNGMLRARAGFPVSPQTESEAKAAVSESRARQAG